MKHVQIDSWDRKEHFNFFLKSDLPFYNVNFKLDITGLKSKLESDSISLNNALIHFTISSMIQIENFLYRLEDGKVVQYDRIDPSFACLRDKEELFRLITVEYCSDIKEFDTIAKLEIQNSRAYFDLVKLTTRSNFAFISSLPWIPFTAIDHTLNIRKEDTIPRVSWGKFQEENNNTFLPYNIQVNHVFIDGIHVGKFYEKLQDMITSYKHGVV